MLACALVLSLIVTACGQIDNGLLMLAFVGLFGAFGCMQDIIRICFVVFINAPVCCICVQRLRLLLPFQLICQLASRPDTLCVASPPCTKTIQCC